MIERSANRRFEDTPSDLRECSISFRLRSLSDRIISGQLTIPTDYILQGTSVYCVASSWTYIASISQFYNIESLTLVGDAASQFGSEPTSRICQRMTNLTHLRIHQESGISMPHEWNHICLPNLRTLILSKDDSVEFVPYRSRELNDWSMYPLLTDISIPICYMSISCLSSIPKNIRHLHIVEEGPVGLAQQRAIETSLSRRFTKIYVLKIPGVTKRAFLKISKMTTLRHLEVTMAEETNQFPVGNLKNLVALSMIARYGFSEGVIPRSFMSLKNLRILQIISNSQVRYPDNFDRLSDLRTLILSLVDSEIPRSIKNCHRLGRIDLLRVSLHSLLNYDLRELPEDTRIISPRYESLKDLADAIDDPRIESHRRIHETISDVFVVHTLQSMR